MKTNLPIVTIVGKQNVGKSTLFNLLAKKKIAITKNIPGVTRDILQETVQLSHNKNILLCDAPGLNVSSESQLDRKIFELALKQIKNSDAILFVFDKKEITEYDYRLIQIFRENRELNQKPIIHCVNKMDSSKDELELDEFYEMGLSEVLPISCLGRKNIKVLVAKLCFLLEAKMKTVTHQVKYNLSIVGKPNSGKSTLLNTLVGFERTVVSEQAGTTRDSIDSIFEYKKNLLKIIDTAGIRKKSHKAKEIEFYSYKRALDSMEQSNVVLYLITAEQGISAFDKKLIQLIQKKGKPLVLAISKWDLLKNKHNNSFANYRETLYASLPSLKNIPIISFSSKEKLRHSKILDLCNQSFENSQIKVTTAELNRNIRQWLEQKIVAESSEQKMQTFYTTQISSCPFKILIFLHNKKKFKMNLVNFLKNRLYKHYKLEGIPVEIELRADRDKKR